MAETTEYVWSFAESQGASDQAKQLLARQHGETPEYGAHMVAGFPAQADAEAWIGENWRPLAANGVLAVELRHRGQRLYTLTLEGTRQAEA
ncbi:hypothetical protein LWF01_06985 [Saxibacter everestensis]|uniref:Uncharacterized protein n=1 Tax=Saxibacter everestensis TaxID=2909229 RepID=A0ABY8QZ03_9MICO|nr:hypothetical protein LWF01_06985 [Brevibacteriaceae bacterium ZFBP1038]